MSEVFQQRSFPKLSCKVIMNFKYFIWSYLCWRNAYTWWHQQMVCCVATSKLMESGHRMLLLSTWSLGVHYAFFIVLLRMSGQSTNRQFWGDDVPETFGRISPAKDLSMHHKARKTQPGAWRALFRDPCIEKISINTNFRTFPTC